LVPRGNGQGTVKNPRDREAGGTRGILKKVVDRRQPGEERKTFPYTTIPTRRGLESLRPRSRQGTRQLKIRREVGGDMSYTDGNLKRGQ